MKSIIDENNTEYYNYLQWIISIQYPTQEKGESKISSTVTIKTYKVKQQIKLFDTTHQAPNLMEKPTE